MGVVGRVGGSNPNPIPTSYWRYGLTLPVGCLAHPVGAPTLPVGRLTPPVGCLDSRRTWGGTQGELPVGGLVGLRIFHEKFFGDTFADFLYGKNFMGLYVN